MELTKTSDEELEIRTLRDLHEIKLEIQEIKALINNNQMQFKIQLAEHQAQCPMMHKDVLLKSDCYTAWKDCYNQHTAETGKTFDKYFERAKKIGIALIIAYAALSNMDITQFLKIVQ